MAYNRKDAHINPYAQFNQYNQYMLNYLSTTDYYNRDFFICRNPEHGDHTPSMKYNPRNNTVHCFSCGKTYDLINLVMVDHQLTFGQAIDWIRVNLMNEKPLFIKVNPNIHDFRDFYKTLDENYEYMAKRGLNEYLCARFGVRYCKQNNSVIITNGVDCYTERFIAPDAPQRYKHYGSIELYNKTQPSNPNKPTIIVEGELDCLSIYEAINFNEGVYDKISSLPINCIGLGSCNNWRKLVASGIDNLILALDNDDAGRRATDDLKAELDKKGIHYIVYNLYGEYKDANEALLKNVKKLRENVKNVLKISAKRV